MVDILESPDDFSALGLAVLWRVLDQFCSLGWDFHVVVVDRRIAIHLGYSGKKPKPGAEQIPVLEIISACLAPKTGGSYTFHDVYLRAHDGSGRTAVTNQFWSLQTGFR